MPRLYIVPTPIGNLEDVTLRALRILGEVSLILAEDTRYTRKLLRHYQISTPLVSYHQHNKRDRIEWTLEKLREADVALVSSAGMPAVSDPGFELILAAVEAQVDVDVLPGPSAVITAVVAAALPAPGFLFAGFLPRSSGERRRRLAELATVPYTLVLYEAPHRLVALLRDIESILGARQVVLARELTKLHQELLRGAPHELLERYAASEPRGEFTVLVGAAAPAPKDRSDEALDELKARHQRGEDRRTILAEVAAKYGLRRNETYRLWLQASREP